MRALLVTMLAFAVACADRRAPSGEADAEFDAAGDGGLDAQPDAQSDGGGDAGTDGGADAAGDGPTDGPAVNHPPALAVTTPDSGSGSIPLDYFIIDADSDPVSITVEWSEDGASWLPATHAAGGTSGLASSPSGVAHTFVWSSGIDLAGRRATVRLRLTPFDGRDTGFPAATDRFTVDNRAPNTPPVASWGAFTTPVAGDQSFTYNAADAESDAVDAAVEFRIGQGAFSPIALAPGSDPLTGRPAAPQGNALSFTWASAADIPADAEAVQLQVTLDDGRAAGAPAQSPRFAVRNAPRTLGVRITEVSAGVPDWIELTNTGASSVTMSGWKLAWARQTQGGEMALPTFQMDPGKRVLITEEQGANTTNTIYLNANIDWGSALPGSAALVDAQAQGVDFLRWGGSTTAAPAGTGWSEPEVVHIPHDGASLVRQGGRDTDASLDFCAAPATRGGADDPCYALPPAAASLRLVEVFAGGATPPDAQNPGDWVEIYNSGPSLDLASWVVVTENEASGAETAALRAVTLATGARLRVVAGPGADRAGVQYTQTANVDLRSRSPGTASLRDPSGRPHDYLRWGGFSGTAPPPLAWNDPLPPLHPPGAFTSLNRISEPSTQVEPGRWCIQRASPDAPASGCIPSAAGSGLRVNEVAPGSFLSTDGAIELVHKGAEAVWLGDFLLRFPGGFGGGDAALDDLTAAAGDRLAFHECVFGGAAAGEHCASAMAWGMFGNQASGYVELIDNTGHSVDFVRWGGDQTEPAGAGAAWTEPAPAPAMTNNLSVGRRENAADTDSSTDWCKQDRSVNAPNGACR